MSLVQCPGCGNKVSDKAIACPKCGYALDEPAAERSGVRTGQPMCDGKLKAKKKPMAMLAIGALTVAVVSFTGGVAYTKSVLGASEKDDSPAPGAPVANDDAESSIENESGLRVLDGVGSESVVEPEGEWAGSFSWQTGDEKYPFAVTEKDFPQNGKHLLDPIAERSSSYPYAINPVEAETTDALPRIEFWMNGDHHYFYAYEIKQVETTEITVVDFDGNERRAMVNTKLALTDRRHDARGDTDRLISQNSYLFKDENGVVYMAIPDLEGADNYVLYC